MRTSLLHLDKTISHNEPMKLKYTGTIEVKPLTDHPDWLVVTKGHGRYEKGERLPLSYLKENGFTAADCESVDLLDPDRTERLCPPVTG